MIPAVAWYVHSWSILSDSGGSTASLDNAHLWLAALSPSSLLDPARLQLYARYVFLRAFTPLALPLLVARLLDLSQKPATAAACGSSWTLSASLGLIAVSGKIHHEYYWLVLAPPAAVALSRGLAFLANQLPLLPLTRFALPLAFAALSIIQSSDTFRLPEEWSHLPLAAKAINDKLPATALIVGPEALLYHSDHKGARLEIHPPSALRAAGEWHATLPPNQDDPALALVELYRGQGLRYLADLPPTSADAPRRALHRRLALRYTILEDGPNLFLIDLQRPAPVEAADHVAFQP